MNLTVLERKVLRLFGDTTQAIVIKQTDIWDWVDEAQLQIIRKTHCVTKTVTGAASTYPLLIPTDYLLGKRMIYGTGNSVVKYIQLDDLDDANINPAATVDTPSYYYLANGRLNLYPNKGATDTASVGFTYVAAATTIVSSATPLDVPLSFHEDIARYCITRAHERNENYRAMEISNGIYEGMSGERLTEASVGEDENFVVRDDPGDMSTYGDIG